MSSAPATLEAPTGPIDTVAADDTVQAGATLGRRERLHGSHCTTADIRTNHAIRPTARLDVATADRAAWVPARRTARIPAAAEASRRTRPRVSPGRAIRGPS